MRGLYQYLTICFLATAPAAPARADDFFTDRIAPLLKQRCLECHSHEAGKMRGGLTLDSKAGWSDGGKHGPAVVPGDVEKSLLLKMVRHADPDHQMPPKEKLPDAEIALLEEWVKQGAPDPRPASVKSAPDTDWWSLKPLISPPVPAASGLSSGHPIDRFLQTRLARANLKPSPPADARTLIRRVTVDLTGLPPSWEETEEFARESAAAPPGVDGISPAWTALVDRLLASPRHGERWARHWLDTIHFADTHGFEHDVYRPAAWRFRDYVIGAFNQDTAWPRFIREQLAADVLFPDESPLTAAIGFLGAGPFDASADGTAQAAYEYVERDDLVTQTMGAFVSTTANCARCHAHKFDPITQEDYFSLQAVFAGVGKGNVAYDEDPSTIRKRQRWTALQQAAQADPVVAEALLTPENQAMVSEWEAAGGGHADWQPLMPETWSAANGTVLTRQADGSLLASGPGPDTDIYTLTFSGPLKKITALRLDLLADDSLPLKGPGRAGNGNLHVSELEALAFRAATPAPEKIAFSRASADFDQVSYAAPGLIDADPKTSWAIHPLTGVPHQAILELATPLILSEGDHLTIHLRQLQPGVHLIGRFKLSVTSAPPAALLALPAAAGAALAVPVEQRPAEARLALATAVLRDRAHQELSRIPAQVQVYAASAANQAARGAILKVPQPRVIYVLKRGDLDKPEAETGPGALTAVTALPARFTLTDPQNEGQRRAALADWIASPDNPLTWRSIVNRVWHYHFGKGLCDTPGDFGRMGGVPSHPELLDWLAVWFRDEAKGSLKALHRLIVTSAAYQQSSASPPAEAVAGLSPGVSIAPSAPVLADPQALDPDNRLLWRMNRSRLDADSCRDAVLAVSGRLDLSTMGGPGTAHYNASPGPQATPVLDYAGFDWESPGAARRSIYRVVYRGIADPFMEMLDFPDMGLLSPVRGFSASALQSLSLFNNPFILGQCVHLADRCGDAGPALPDQIRRMVRLVLLREPDAEELAGFTALAGSAGLPAVARVLLNTNEFLFVD